MLRRSAARAVMAVWFAMLVPYAALADVTDREARSVPLAPGTALSLEITVGHVRVAAADRHDVGLTVVRTAPTREALARIPLVVETGGGVSITVTQAAGATDAALRTDVTLEVPREAHLQSIRILEGALDISGFGGTIGADVRRGDITASDVSGTLRLETGIGSVIVTGARLVAGGLLRLRAFNGDVRLSLAERPADARIMALALNGTIESAIPLNMKTAWGPHWGETTLGRGAPVISIDIITGRIVIAVEGAVEKGVEGKRGQAYFRRDPAERKYA